MLELEAVEELELDYCTLHSEEGKRELSVRIRRYSVLFMSCNKLVKS
jgi:hypothetical protein